MAISRIEPFQVEKWMDKYEGTAKYNIAETCAASISLNDLKDLSSDEKSSIIQLDKKLTYGAICGSDQLLSNLSALYSLKVATPLPKENILVTPGAISANFILFYALLSKGDHVICHYPTYQQLYSVPESLGAEVSLWKASEKDGWRLDIEELKGLIRPNTKMIIINNPQNPTGAIVKKSLLRQLVDTAREHDIIVMSDEVYRPLFHSIQPTDAEFPPSILSMGYSKVIATSSMSKAFALAGIRVGWIASRSQDIIEACQQSRDYTTISVSQIDDQIASFALGYSCLDSLLSRNINLARTNLGILERFIESHRYSCDWVRPVAGTTAFVRFSRQGKAVDDVALCKLAHGKYGVMFCPGSLCFGGEHDFRGYIRIGYACESEVLTKGLQEMELFMQAEFADVPLAS